ncbi:hypothetical protein J2X32_001290 [Rheinheimera pacifica]|nr:hypothetical protein [Rheinheimera pacifica]
MPNKDSHKRPLRGLNLNRYFGLCSGRYKAIYNQMVLMDEC